MLSRHCEERSDRRKWQKHKRCFTAANFNQTEVFEVTVTETQKVSLPGDLIEMYKTVSNITNKDELSFYQILKETDLFYKI